MVLDPILLCFPSQHQLSASSEYDPEISTQITPLSKMKNVNECTNLESLSQLTPNFNKGMDQAAVVPHVSTDVIAEASTHAETTPAKHSSSKRVKLIKQEKK